MATATRKLVVTANHENSYIRSDFEELKKKGLI